MTKQSITRIYAVTIDNKTRLIEAASGVEVWSNSAENRSNDDDQAARNKVLRQTIQDALSNYPPAP